MELFQASKGDSETRYMIDVATKAPRDTRSMLPPVAKQFRGPKSASRVRHVRRCRKIMPRRQRLPRVTVPRAPGTSRCFREASKAPPEDDEYRPCTWHWHRSHTANSGSPTAPRAYYLPAFALDVGVAPELRFRRPLGLFPLGLFPLAPLDEDPIPLPFLGLGVALFGGLKCPADGCARHQAVRPAVPDELGDVDAAAPSAPSALPADEALESPFFASAAAAPCDDVDAAPLGPWWNAVPCSQSSHNMLP